MITVDILDPALRRKGGHHAEWCRLTGRLLARRGMRVRIHGHRTLEPAVLGELGEGVEVVPTFSVDPYEVMRTARSREGLDTWFNQAVAALAIDLARTPGAHFHLAPTCFPPLLAAFARARKGARLGACIHDDPTRLPIQSLPMWRRSLAASRARNVDLILGVTTPELQAIYRSALGEVVGDLPLLPICEDGLQSSSPRTALVRVGFFGRQDRAGKGIAGLFGPLGTALAARGYELLLHDSSGSASPQFAFPVASLGYVPNLADAIRSCDLVIAPYRAERYRNAGSGVVWAAMACGVPVLAPENTSPGRLVRERGAGVLFARRSVEDICEAVEAARARYPELAAAAHRASLEWPERNGVLRFTQALMGKQAMRRSQPVAIASAPRTSAMKVAVVTPYYEEPEGTIRRCIDSVASQTHRCTHILIGDGAQRNLEASENLIPLSLPRGAADYGDTPRAVAGIYAAGLGFDAIAYLDADNWYFPRHIESLVDMARRSGAAVVTSRRALYGMDDERLLAECLMSDGEKFSDTNCLFFTRDAFGLLPVWALMDRRMHAIDDRVIWHEVLRSKLPRAHTARPTVGYLATHAPIYRDLGLPVPMGAKDPVEIRTALAAWAAAGKPSLKLRASYRRLRRNPEAQ